MRLLAPAARLATLFCLLATSACEEKSATTSTEEGSEASEKDGEKKQQVDALLRANGIDPKTLKATTEDDAAKLAAPAEKPAPPGQAADPAPPSDKADGSAATPKPADGDSPIGVRYDIKVTSKGAEPRSILTYPFGKGEKRSLSMDLKTTSALTVNGQPLQTAPPVQVSVTGTSTTLSEKDGVFQRENVFSSLSPAVSGLPPEMVAQVKAQYDLLKGIRLIETVNGRGELLNVEVPPQAQIQSQQVLVVLQLLQDTLSRSRAPLPSEPVGKGASWTATASAENGGVVIKDEVSAKLVSLTGGKAIIEVEIKQLSPGGKLDLPQLPPGASVELLGVAGTGSGQIEVDTKNLLLTARVNVKTSRDTKTIDPSAPEPILETVETTTQFDVRLR